MNGLEESKHLIISTPCCAIWSLSERSKISSEDSTIGNDHF